MEDNKQQTAKSKQQTANNKQQTAGCFVAIHFIISYMLLYFSGKQKQWSLRKIKMKQLPTYVAHKDVTI